VLSGQADNANVIVLDDNYQSSEPLNRVKWYRDKMMQGKKLLEGVILFNATFNNISVISWRSVLLVGEIGVLGENHRPVASHW
jgi:hypothetical protein